MTERNAEQIDAAAKLLAGWIGYAWDGIREGRIADRGFRQWAYNGIGDLHFQGGKQDLRDLAVQIADAANGESTQTAKEG